MLDRLQRAGFSNLTLAIDAIDPASTSENQRDKEEHDGRREEREFRDGAVPAGPLAKQVEQRDQWRTDDRKWQKQSGEATARCVSPGGRGLGWAHLERKLSTCETNVSGVIGLAM